MIECRNVTEKLVPTVLRGNAVCDALRRPLGRGASRTAFPRRAWERVGMGTWIQACLVTLAILLAAIPARALDDTPRPGPAAKANAPVEVEPEKPQATATGLPKGLLGADEWKSVKTVGLFAIVSLAPAALLMMTAFVRIQIVLVLLRQALGSPQVPGNQVLTALALLLTVLVMKPVGENVYQHAVAPLMAGTSTPAQAWEDGSRPIKRFMVDQIVRTRHEHYLVDLYDYAVPPTPDRKEPKYGDDYPFHVIAPAFLLSELTTALTIGFIIYLPFLVIDLVVSAVLAAMGLFMLPPTLVALPLKLILFVLADGWLLVASRLLQTFSVGG
jgi:flagellar biosynthesis protein FliP